MYDEYINEVKQLTEKIIKNELEKLDEEEENGILRCDD